MVRQKIALVLRCLAVSALLAASHSAAQAQSGSVQVPIHEIDLSDGTRRYVVTIKIDSQPIDAGLDTGSVGLRVLPGGVDTATTKTVGPVQRYSYGAGTTLEGPVVRTAVSVGGLQNGGRWQIIRAIGCSAARPDCPAAHVDSRKFGIQGNGLAGEGFRAILGVGLANADLPNPFQEIGAHRWIIELPRPGETSSGRLILNPSDEQVAGFTSLLLADSHRSRANDAVRACLEHDGGKPICAPTLIDCGAPGIELVNHRADTGWTEGMGARLTFEQHADTALGIRFSVGRRAQASRFDAVADPRVNGVRIRSGLLTYFAYDVLYDADRDSIAIKPRPAYSDGVAAVGGNHSN